MLTRHNSKEQMDKEIIGEDMNDDTVVGVKIDSTESISEIDFDFQSINQ